MERITTILSESYHWNGKRQIDKWTEILFTRRLPLESCNRHPAESGKFKIQSCVFVLVFVILAFCYIDSLLFLPLIDIFYKYLHSSLRKPGNINRDRLQSFSNTVTLSL